LILEHWQVARGVSRDAFGETGMSFSKAAFSPPERLYGQHRPLTETTPAGVWAGIFRFAAPRDAPVFVKHPRRALGCQWVGKTLAFYGIEAG
jgi:hypothetical protein